MWNKNDRKIRKVKIKYTLEMYSCKLEEGSKIFFFIPTTIGEALDFYGAWPNFPMNPGGKEPVGSGNTGPYVVFQ
jgi:hypothetical protein